MNRLKSFEKLPPMLWMAVGCFISAGIGFTDFLTGSEIAFSLFYLIPIVLVTWFLGKNFGLVISVFAAITWFVADSLSGNLYSSPIIGYWNAFVRLSFFILVSQLLPALKTLELEKQIARIDDLTGAANRRYFFEILNAELDRSQRYNRFFTIAYIDLDGFKSVNDKFGHQTGDKVLCAIVNGTKRHLRKTDFMARLGGDEFILLLSETDQNASKVTVPKIQSALMDEMKRNSWPVTFSIGVLTYLKGQQTADELVSRADDLMYTVKKNGKNSIAYSVYPA